MKIEFYKQISFQNYFSSKRVIVSHTKYESFYLDEAFYRTKIGFKITKLSSFENWDFNHETDSCVFSCIEVFWQNDCWFCLLLEIVPMANFTARFMVGRQIRKKNQIQNPKKGLANRKVHVLQICSFA